ncbi:MFS transporter [Celeribacter indicus]|uniref:Major facilitator superfamily protein n=1 Tax=Celeribacter indicus TaxID=1208324 RepID=A0A0B5DRA8_9RHOB|nr:MFS transporter [Celeribacter indicus]AJE46058.1 major facilitator superfamily protein [Celeribacter indicus]SDX33903.1 Major Facilitator Superfamily protein [Celeribacter indicus]
MKRALPETLALSRASFAALGTMGAIWGAFAAMVPELKAQAGASDAQFGTALLGSAAGGMVAMLLAPRLLARLGRATLPVLGLAALLASQLPLLATRPAALFPVLACMGLALASLDVCTNLRLAHLEARHGRHLMNMNHAAYSLCLGLAALAVAALRRAGWGVADLLPVLGAVLLPVVLLTIEPRAAFAEEAGSDAGTPPASLPWAAILPVALMLFVAFLSENAIESWSALFLERELGAMAGAGGFGPSTLGFTMAAFRLAGHLSTRRFGEARTLFWSGVSGMCGALVLALSPTEPVALAGICLTAVGMAVVVPTATSLLGKRVHRRQRDLAISRAWLIGFTGFFVGPTAIGLISELHGLRVAFLAVAGLIFLILPAVRLFGRVTSSGR